jgi:PKD repeat protein
VPAIVVLACLALPASAFAQTVNIEDAGYNPATVTVAPGSVVTWHYANTNLLAPHGVQFGSDTQTCPPGTSGLSPDCQKSFPDPGRFTYHDVGCNAGDSGCITGEVVVYVPPTASFTAGPNPALRGQTLNFDGSASASPGGSIVSYSWDFGDGSGASGATTSHAYAAAGTFDVKLFATDDQGGVAVQTQQVTVNVPDSDGDGLNDDLDKCVSIPAATLDGCPPPPLVARTVAPSVLSVAGVLKSGVNVVLSCSSVCRSTFALLRGTTPVGATTFTLPLPGSTLVTVRLSTVGRTLLAHAKSVKLTLKSTVTDPFAQTRTLTRTVNMRTVKTVGTLPAIGISDQQATTFADPNFQILKLKYARLMTPWNGIFKEPARLDAWLQAARAAGVRPLVSFEHARGDQCPKKPCRAPSIGQYSRAWTAFHKKYPWIKDVSPWNEINSATQPTGKRPDLAASYYNVVRAKCRGCSIVAADLLDATNIRTYVASFLKRAKGKPRLWGLHNYTDTNRFRSRGTTALLQSVKGTVWLTETGGVVKFTTQGGKVALPKSESRAKKAMDYMFRLAELNARRIKRIYVYQWKVNNSFDRFDAGLLRPDGTPRPSFDVLSLNASIARKR